MTLGTGIPSFQPRCGAFGPAPYRKSIKEVGVILTGLMLVEK